MSVFLPENNTEHTCRKCKLEALLEEKGEEMEHQVGKTDGITVVHGNPDHPCIYWGMLRICLLVTYLVSETDNLF